MARLNAAARSLTQVQIAVFAKAPIPHLAKTRLIPALGARGAARLQRRLTMKTVRAAIDAGLGDVTLWCAPDAEHRFFRALHRTTGVDRIVQTGADLGERMLASFQWHCAAGPLLLVGTDCPSLTSEHLRQAAAALLDGVDAVFIPARDGGYVLVGLRAPQPAIFREIKWSTGSVMEETRAQARSAGIAVHEFEPLSDIDVPEDLEGLTPSQAAILGIGRNPLEP